MTEQLTFLRIADVLRRTGLGRATLYRRIRAGLFPQPTKLSIQSVGWIEANVDGYNVLIAAGATDDQIADYVTELVSGISSHKPAGRERVRARA